MTFRGATLVALLAVATPLVRDTMAARPADPQPSPVRFGPASDEFVGPFPSWTNVKTAYGAVGDGRADDTAALQRALAEVRKDGRSPVLFLPDGTYRITSTLLLAYEQNVSVIGADPSNVLLVWDGPKGGTMLWLNGVAYSQVSRLSFDGKRTASVAVEQSADGTGGHFDTGNLYADNRFVDVEYGIHGGFKKAGGFAETSIVRNRFIRNTRAGVALGNFNALDIWIWNALFDHCRVGVTNEPGAGAFRVYDSVFISSTLADLFMQNTGSFSARGNYSVGSSAFYLSGPPINHPAAIDIQANVIVDPQKESPIHLANQGPGLFVDNVVKSRADSRGPVVWWRSSIDADVASVGNTFTVPRALSVNGRLISVDDRIVPREKVAVEAPRLPSTPPRVGREVFEVPSGSDAAAIQQAIDAAARAVGRRPVVHLPAGAYPIAEAIRVPPGDVRIQGDGGDTRLEWKGSANGPVLRVAGPTAVTLRDLTIVGTGDADGIVVEGVDRPGSRVSLTGVQLSAAASTNLLVDGIEHASLQLVDVDHKYTPRGTSVRVLGKSGVLAAEARGRTVIFSGASAGNGLSYDIAGPATVLVRDIWYEGETAEGFARVRDGAAFTLQGARAATPREGPAAISIANAGGRTALLTTHLDDRIVVSENGLQRVLGLGVLFEFHRLPVLDGPGRPSAMVKLLNSRQRVEAQGLFSPGTVPVPDEGSVDPSFILAMLADSRAVVSPDRTPVAAGATDLRLDRVFVTNGRNNLIIRP